MAVNETVLRGLQIVRETQASIAAMTRTPPPPPVVRPSSRAHAVTETDSLVAPPTAFVSWAHSHPSWTKEQTSDWESQVAAFAALLRRFGIRADVDLFHLDEPKDWTRFGPQQVQAAKFTLVVMSQAWAERWSGSNSPRVGAGAAAEADTLRGLFAHDQEAWQRRVVLVMFPEVVPGVVPPDMQRVTRVAVNPSDPDSFEGLIRLLTEQPRYPKPPIGEVPVLGATSGYEHSFALETYRERLAEIELRKAQLRNKRTHAADREREQLDLSESATRGFIDAELTIED